MSTMTIVRKSSVVLGLPENLVNDSRLSVSAKYAMLRVLSQPAGKQISVSEIFNGNEEHAKAALFELRDNGYIKITATLIDEKISDIKLEIVLHDDVSEFSSKTEQPVVRITCPKCKHWWMSDEDADPDSAKLINGFDEFWAVWPRKFGKSEAKKKWLTKHCHLHVAKIVASVKQWSCTRQWQQGYIPHAATWLNQNRWEDDVSQLNVIPKMQQRTLC